MSDHFIYRIRSLLQDLYRESFAFNMKITDVYIIFVINLYNILNQASPTNVILNALALEFVFTIDEDYARVSWWDFSKRWLKAGMIEVYIQSQFEYRALIDNRLFSKKYKIDIWEIDRVQHKKGTLLYDCDVSCKDRINLKFMSHTEAFEYFCKCETAKLLGDGDFDGKFPFLSSMVCFVSYNLWLYIVKKNFSSLL